MGLSARIPNTRRQRGASTINPGAMALDGLYVPQNASWLSDFRSELLSFPAGNHDDIVDALIGQLLDYMAEGTPLPKPDKNKIGAGYRAFDFESADDWKRY